MNIQETIVNGVAVVTVTGRIDSGTAAAWETELLSRLTDGRAALVLDLADVGYLSSAGIRVLVLLYKRGAAANVPIALARTQDHVQEILAISGLDDVLPAHPSVESAIEATR